MLNGQAEALAFALFPAAVRSGGLIHVGSVRGEAGNSLKIDYRGDKAGRWVDYSLSPGDREGVGDMLKLVMLTVAPPVPGEQPMANAVRWAKGWLGIESMDPAALERHRQRAEAAQRRAEAGAAKAVDKSRAKARGLFLSAAPIVGTPAMRYLEGRGIDFARIGRVPRAFRFRHDVWQPDLARPCPAMLIAGIGPDGSQWATHCTFLDRRSDGSWGKLPDLEEEDPETGEVRRVKIAKKIFGKAWLGTHFPIHRGASRKALKAMPAGEPVYVSEGAEDGLTGAMIDPARRIIMAGTLGNIGQLWLPEQCGDVVLLAQRDTKEKAIEHTEAVIATLQRRASEAGSARRVLALWPAEGFKDLNDELRGVRS